jgi:hypothetical protein
MTICILPVMPVSWPVPESGTTAMLKLGTRAS